MIKGYCIPAGSPWHLVDEVYIPVNCDKNFHWVLAVVALKERAIRVYDSTMGARHRNPSSEIQKMTVMLPTYLQESGFFEKITRNDWSMLDAYKDKATEEMIGQQIPFKVEFVQEIAQQQSDSFDCGVLVAAYAEYISDGIPVPTLALDTAYLRRRYAALLWKYGSDKASEGYVSKNDDPPKSRAVFITPESDRMIDIS